MSKLSTFRLEAHDVYTFFGIIPRKNTLRTNKSVSSPKNDGHNMIL